MQWKRDQNQAAEEKYSVDKEADNHIVYVQETTQVTWKLNRKEAEKFIKERKTASRSEYKRGALKPDRVDRRVEVQDSNLEFMPKERDSGGNENHEPHV